MIKKVSHVAFLIALFFSSCKDAGCNMIINSSIQETLSLQNSLELSMAHTWVYIHAGNCGLIVYNNGEKVVAYDRCSPVRQSSNSKLEVDGMQVIDNVTGAKWLLFDGSPTHLAECSLQSYNVRKNGNLYVISN